jgi:hypothetical protein
MRSWRQTDRGGRKSSVPSRTPRTLRDEQQLDINCESPELLVSGGNVRRPDGLKQPWTR